MVPLQQYAEMTSSLSHSSKRRYVPKDTCMTALLAFGMLKSRWETHGLKYN